MPLILIGCGMVGAYNKEEELKGGLTCHAVQIQNVERK